jgi:hypothetical protein
MLTNLTGLVGSPVALDIDRSEQSSYMTATDNGSIHKGELEIDYSSHLTRETPSILASETSSYRRREVELSTIKKRFGNTKVRRSRKSAVRSKFKEEFDSSQNPSVATKSSFLSRLQITIPRRVMLRSKDHRWTTSEPAKRPKASLIGEKLSHSYNPEVGEEKLHGQALEGMPILGHTKIEESTPNMRGRALRLESTEPTGQHHTKFQQAKRFIRTWSANQLQSKARDSENQNKGKAQPEDGSRAVQVAVTNTEEAAKHTVSAPDAILDKQGSKSMEDLKLPRRKITKPPTSWAKWPPPSRASRSGLENEADNVMLRDFAVRAISDNGTILWATDRPRIAEGGQFPAGKRSLSGKLGQAMKSGLGRLIHVSSGPSGSELGPNEGEVNHQSPVLGASRTQESSKNNEENKSPSTPEKSNGIGQDHLLYTIGHSHRHAQHHNGQTGSRPMTPLDSMETSQDSTTTTTEKYATPHSQLSALEEFSSTNK